jgi:quinol monooxygenase YgiN
MIIALGDVYVRIPERDEVRELMRRTQAATRSQPGCRRYEFAEAVDEPGRFAIVQVWEDSAALERHYRSQAFADYQAAIGAYLVRTTELRVYQADAGVTPFDPSPIESTQDD